MRKLRNEDIKYLGQILTSQINKLMEMIDQYEVWIKDPDNKRRPEKILMYKHQVKELKIMKNHDIKVLGRLVGEPTEE